LFRGLTQNNQIWYDNTYGEEVCFYGSGIPQNFSDLHHVRPNGLTYSDQIWYDNTRGIEACIQGVSRAPIPMGRGPSVPKILGPLTYAQTVWPRTTKFVTIAHACRRLSLKGQARPLLRGRGAGVPQSFATSYMRAHSMINNDQILHGDQTRCEDNFYTVDTRMLTRDLFAVANLLVNFVATLYDRQF